MYFLTNFLTKIHKPLQSDLTGVEYASFEDKTSPLVDKWRKFYPI